MIRLSIIGNICNDPHSSTLGSGKQVCNFVVAVNSRRGEREHTEFVACAVWGKQGEACQQYLAKGRKVYVSGEAESHLYQSKDGTNRAGINLSADSVEFLTPRGDADDGGHAPTAAAEQRDQFAQVNTDDLPF